MTVEFLGRAHQFVTLITIQRDDHVLQSITQWGESGYKSHGRWYVCQQNKETREHQHKARRDGTNKGSIL